jgi:hypothetical protein
MDEELEAQRETCSPEEISFLPALLLRISANNYKSKDTYHLLHASHTVFSFDPYKNSERIFISIS